MDVQDDVRRSSIYGWSSNWVPEGLNPASHSCVCSRRPTRGAPPSSACAWVPSSWSPPGCSTGARRSPTGTPWTSWRPGTPEARPTGQRSTSTTGTSSPPPAPHRGSTPVSITSAPASAPRLPTRSPDRSWWHLFARADILSTSSGRSRHMLQRTDRDDVPMGARAPRRGSQRRAAGLRGAHEPTLVREKLPSLNRLGASHLGPLTASRRGTPAGA